MINMNIVHRKHVLFEFDNPSDTGGREDTDCTCLRL